MLGNFLSGLSNLGQIYRGYEQSQAQDAITQLRRAQAQTALQEQQAEQQRQQALTALGQGFPELAKMPPPQMAGGAGAGGGAGGATPDLSALPQSPTSPAIAAGAGQPTSPLSPANLLAPPVSGGANYAGLSLPFRSAVSDLETRMSPDLRGGMSVQGPSAGLRSIDQQGEIRARHEGMPGGVAAHPAALATPDAPHVAGRAADVTFTDPKTEAFVRGAEGAARSGLGFPVKNDPNHLQLLDRHLDQTGQQLINSGTASGPAVQDSTKTAMVAGRHIDPSQWGRASLNDAINAIEKANPNAPPAVKALAVIQMAKLLAPEDKLALQSLWKENEHGFRLELEGIREAGRKELETQREAGRKELETQREGGRKELETQREGSRKELETQREGGRKELETQREEGRKQLQEQRDRAIDARAKSRNQMRDTVTDRSTRRMVLGRQLTELNNDLKTVATDTDEGKQRQQDLLAERDQINDEMRSMAGIERPYPPAPQAPQEAPSGGSTWYEPWTWGR